MNEVQVPQLGWVPGGKSSSGRYFSEYSIGHTGFTGTSIRIDFDKSLGGCFLYLWCTIIRISKTRCNSNFHNDSVTAREQVCKA